MSVIGRCIGRCVLAVLVPAVAVAQGVTAPPGLSLNDVVQAALTRSTPVLQAQQQEEIGLGALISAAAPFAVQFGTFGGRAQTGTMDPATGADTLATQVNYGLGLKRQFRQGPIFSSEVGATQTSLGSVANAAQSRVSLKLNVIVPLLNDRGGLVTSAPERAARSEHDASILVVRHTASEAVRAATFAYWDYLAAQKRLAAQQSAESRAQQLVDQTRVLVAADERTPSDLNQMLGHLASTRVQRLAAEIAVLDAQLQLGLLIGLDSEAIAALPGPATDFPSSVTLSTAATPARLADLAASQRADLAASDLTLRAARTRADAARGGVQPRFDLQISLGYTGLTSGAGFDRFLAAYYRNVPGLDLSVSIRHELFTRNLDARGRLLAAIAGQQQQQIAQDDLRRRVTAGVQVAYEAFGRSGRAVAEADTAVRLYQTIVQNEQRKFQLGVSTLFDIIQAEDGLTSAMLDEVAIRQEYARALATLRFETGTLLTSDARGPAVDVANLLTAP
jgi:outer membrane protein TolC